MNAREKAAWAVVRRLYNRVEYPRGVTTWHPLGGGEPITDAGMRFLVEDALKASR